jgi:rhodanese-related sulfurtransferase/DNA-binding transcriptional ArsR family regulator
MPESPNPKRAFKDRVFGELERIGKALGSRRRLELLDVLSQGPHSVEQLATELDISVANASQHVLRLHDANMVSRRREGSRVYYAVANDDVAQLYAALRRVAEAQLPGLDAAVDQFFETPSVQTDDISAILDAADSGDVLLIDTRPRHEYSAGHVRGARSVPLAELNRLEDDLPRDKTIVAYCRGPFCTFADTAVKRLRRDGYDARRLELAVTDFRRHGIAIERAPR